MDLKYCSYVTTDVQLRIHVHMELAVPSVTSHTKQQKNQEQHSYWLLDSYIFNNWMISLSKWPGPVAVSDHKVILRLNLRVVLRPGTEPPICLDGSDLGAQLNHQNSSIWLATHSCF